MGWLDVAYKGAVIAGGVGTLALAAYAYFGEGLRKRWNSPRLILEIGESSENRFNKTGHRSIQYYLLRIRNKKSSTEAKRVRVKLIEYYRQEDNKSAYEKMLLPVPLHFSWAATPDDEPSHLSDFITFDAIIIGYVEENAGLFQLATTPDILQFTGAVFRGDKILIKIEINAENTIQNSGYILQICLPERDHDPFKGGNPLLSAGPFLIPSITEISEKQFNQLTKS